MGHREGLLARCSSSADRFKLEWMILEINQSQVCTMGNFPLTIVLIPIEQRSPNCILMHHKIATRFYHNGHYGGGGFTFLWQPPLFAAKLHQLHPYQATPSIAHHPSMLCALIREWKQLPSISFCQDQKVKTDQKSKTGSL